MNKIHVPAVRAVVWLIAILLGALQAWVYRFVPSSEDIVSYLDIADAYLQGEWNVAINGTWSPLYSWLLGLIISILKPSPYWEFPVVKFLNFLIYLFALICFDLFLRELIFFYQEKTPQSPNRAFIMPEWAWAILGYTLFIWSSLVWIGIYCDTPDLCTAALVYLASGIVLRVHTRSDSWFNFIMLGLCLGFGYLSKAAMFPLAFVFLTTAMLSVCNLRRALPRVLVALLVFTIVSSPFIVALSIAKGRLTFSDAGKLSYAWFVNPGDFIIPDHHWQGGPPGSGTPKHPTRKILDAPPVYEFGTPIRGTYPPWTEPSYWYEGLTVKFNLKKMIRILWRNTSFYYTQFLGSLILSYLILICVASRFRSFLIRDLAKNWRLFIPAIAGLVIYMIPTDFQLNFIRLQPSTRFIAPFIVLLFAGAFASVRLPNSHKSKKLIVSLSTIALIIIVGRSYQESQTFVTVLRQPEHIHWQVTDGLNQLKSQSGEKVAILGSEDDHEFWARLARVKIVAQIPDISNFWAQDVESISEVFKTVEKTGARIIVNSPQSKMPDSISTASWQKIGNTGYSVHFLR